MRRFVHNTFTSHYKSTIGVDFALKVIQHESDMIVSLQLWDIAGQERFGNMTRAYYKGAVGAFVVYDVSRPITFQNVTRWKNDIDNKVRLQRTGNSIPVILLANKVLDSTCIHQTLNFWLQTDFSSQIDQHVNPKTKVEMDDFCEGNGFIKWWEFLYYGQLFTNTLEKLSTNHART